MQNGRASAIRFNEWIYLCTQQERAIARLGRQVYQGYLRGLVTDYSSIELCKQIADLFRESKALRAELEDDLEREALDGLNVEESKKAEEAIGISSSQKLSRRARLAFIKILGRGKINRALVSYRDQIRQLSNDLGLRAVVQFEVDPILKIKGHRELCQLAVKLDQESNIKWDQITQAKKDGASSNSFHTALLGFITSFAKFIQLTPVGKSLLKALKYDSKEEERKLTKQFEGSKTASALEAQMAEIEEPTFDIGKEMASLEQQYEATPTDWGLPQKATQDTWISSDDDTWTSGRQTPQKNPTPVKPTPTPTLSTQPDPLAQSDNLPAAIPKPQIIRQRPSLRASSDTQNWTTSDPFQKSISPQQEMQGDPTDESTPVDDWSIETQEPPEPGATMVDLRSKLPSFSPPANPEPSSKIPDSEAKAAPLKSGLPKAPGLSPSEPPPKPSSLRSFERDLPPLPPMPSVPYRSLDLRPDSLPTSPPLKPPSPSISPPPATKDPTDDNLLPTFLRNRPDDDSTPPPTYIPDLPESISKSESLRILPFGSPVQDVDDDPFSS